MKSAPYFFAAGLAATVAAIHAQAGPGTIAAMLCITTLVTFAALSKP